MALGSSKFALRPGGKCEYWSKSKQAWMWARFVEMNENGTARLNCKSHAALGDIRPFDNSDSVKDSESKRRRIESPALLSPAILDEALESEDYSNNIAGAFNVARSPSSVEHASSSSAAVVAHESTAGDCMVQWMYQGQASEWICFAAEDALAVEECRNRWRASANPQDGGSQISVSIGQGMYTIEFVKMTQTNQSTGKCRRLRRQTNPRCEDDLYAKQAQLDLSGCASEDRLKQRAEEAEARLQAAEMRLQVAESKLGTLESMKSETCLQHQAELEIWKQHALDKDMQFYDKPNLVAIISDALQRFVHDSHECIKGMELAVSSVHEIVNVRLWKQYCHHRDLVKGSLQNRSSCLWAWKEAPPTKEWCEVFPWMTFDRSSNEVLLLHGTTNETAQKIAKQGFDDRLCSRGLYGRGVYLTTDFCKTLQYCDKSNIKTILIARVILGDFYVARGPMETHERPPEVVGCGLPHDSTVAKPGTPKGKGKGKGKKKQIHWEFVVPRGDLQIYPEFLVKLEG